MSDYFMNQALRNMTPFLSEDNRLELIGTLTALFWLIGGMFSDPILLLISMVISIGIMIYLGVISLLPNSKYYYDLHVASFRRMIVAGLANWMYNSGRSQGPETLILFEVEIPILLISQLVLTGLVVSWFASRYFDQLRDPNIDETLYPFIIVRGLLRGAMLAALIVAVFSTDLVDPNLTMPWLFLIYLVEPFWYGLMQSMNPTMSRMELTVGNARLPSVALRESFLANFFILFFTMSFKGVEGQEWELLRVFYLIGLVVSFVYSMDAIKKFKAHPLGKQAIGTFFEDTPDILKNLDLEKQMGMIVNSSTVLDLSKKAGIQLEPGSILVPLEETKGKMSALVIGNAKNIVNDGKQKVVENIEGVSTILIPKGQFNQLTNQFLSTRLSEINLSDLNLPSLPELQQYVASLANNFSSFVERLSNKLSEIDLTGYGITESEHGTEVNLPGIYVNETPDSTNVRVGGIRVNEVGDATTVRIGSSLTVVDLPKVSFVALPGITVLDVTGQGSAVSILGFKISDGLPADKLDHFRELILAQLDRWELGIDAELGRFLADKSASGLLSVGWDGEFNMLLDSKSKTLGNHIALETANQKGMHFLPPNFDEQIEETNEMDKEFIALTGVDPTPGRKSTVTADPVLSLPSKEATANKDKKKDYDFNIIDVELEESDED